MPHFTMCQEELQPFTVSVRKDSVIVGLVPRKISIILNKKWLFNYLPSYWK